MRKSISFLLAFILTFSCFAFCPTDADAIGTVWVKEYYKDKFGDITDQYYLTNKSQFTGTYNSDSVSDESLGVNLIFERDGDTLLAYIILYLNGQDKVKNGTSSKYAYNISVKRVDGTQFTTTGHMPSGKDRIEISNVNDIANALSASGDEIGIYIEDTSNVLNNYVFKAKCGNFKELYQQEIIIPYLEDRYQKAEELFEQKKYDEAIRAFQLLENFKDSSARVEEVKEAKKSESYDRAKQFLKDGEYESAISTFRALGNYKDSSSLIVEAKKAWIKLLSYGDTISFGYYEQDGDQSNGKEPIEWIVLNIQDNKAMVLSEYGLDSIPYNIENRKVTWESCSLRSWLNNEFMNTAFSEEQKKAIILTNVNNSELEDWNSEYFYTEVDDSILERIDKEQENMTEDYLYLLSYVEAHIYLPEKELRRCHPTVYAINQGAYENDGYCRWWYRSPSNSYGNSTCGTADGSIFAKEITDPCSTVRPVMWIDIDGLVNTEFIIK